MTTIARSLEQELLTLERRFWQAMKDKDGDAAARLSDDPCIITGAQGVAKLEPHHLRSMLEDANWTLREFQIDDEVQLHAVSDDVAILAYKVHEDLVVDGKPVSLDAADASTWVRRDGRWLCALHTESVAGDPFGRDRRPA